MEKICIYVYMYNVFLHVLYINNITLKFFEDININYADKIHEEPYVNCFFQEALSIFTYCDSIFEQDFLNTQYERILFNSFFWSYNMSKK